MQPILSMSGGREREGEGTGTKEHVPPGRCVTHRSCCVARDADVGYKASTRGVMAKCVLYMIGGWYVEASTRGVMRDAA
jgi:hypothetical protein